MSDDWAKKYVDIHKEKQQEKQDTQEKVRLAKAAAPDMFQRIKNRIQQDLITFHEAGVLQELQFVQERLTEEFAVSAALHSSQPRRSVMTVQLESILIKYVYSLPENDGAASVSTTHGTLRICADLDGTIRVYRNGNGKPFADESEISEFLLKPVLEYVESK